MVDVSQKTTHWLQNKLYKVAALIFFIKAVEVKRAGGG